MHNCEPVRSNVRFQRLPDLSRDSHAGSRGETGQSLQHWQRHVAASALGTAAVANAIAPPLRGQLAG